MATFLIQGIVWDREVDGKTVKDDLPRYAIVWLPGYEACDVPEDDVQAVMDKLTDDFGFCILNYTRIITLEAVDQDEHEHPYCKATPKTTKEMVSDAIVELVGGSMEAAVHGIQCMGSGCLFDEFTSDEMRRGALITLQWMIEFQRDAARGQQQS